MPAAEPDGTPGLQRPRLSPLLRFPAPLEAEFEALAGPHRARRLVARGAMALALYDVFLVADSQILPDIFPLALFLRLGLVSPISVLLLVVLWRQPPVWLREAIVALSAILATASTLGLILMSSAPYRTTEHHALILVILFATVVQQLRFPYAVATCAAILLMQAVGLGTTPNYPFELWAQGNIILAGASVLVLAAAWSLERDARLAFLNSRRERLTNVELSALSLHDPLTGLGNRRSLDALLAAAERKGGGQLAVLLFDIDHFKQYNDSLGHQGGDVCLKRIAGVLRGELREHGDGAVRFGGEEFLAVLPGTDLPTAVAVAERIRRAVEAAAIPHPGRPEPDAVVTISAGAAAAMLGEGLAAGEIIAGADAALYAAKRNGRNQVWPPFLGAAKPEVIALPTRGQRASSAST